MENGELIELLKKHPKNMIVKIRYAPLTVADIHGVDTSSFCEDIANKPIPVIVIENDQIKVGKI